MKRFILITALICMSIYATAQELHLKGFSTSSSNSVFSIGSRYAIQDTILTDTIQVLMVYTDRAMKYEAAGVHSVIGFSVRKQHGFYNNVTADANGWVNSVYVPAPLMIHEKYLDFNKKDLPSNRIVLMSKFFEP